MYLKDNSEKQKSFSRLNWVFKNLKIESSYGQKALSEIIAYKSKEEQELRNHLSEINSIIEKLKKDLKLFSDFNKIFMELRNISGSIRNLKNDFILGETELFEIKNFIILVSNILELAKNNDISPKILINLDLTNIIKILNPDKIITRTFYIHEFWSDKLREIRDRKKIVETEIIKEENLILKEELRKKRAEIVNEEREEELNVRKLLSSRLKKYIKDFDLIINNIGLFELKLAKAELAIRYNCCIPEVLDFDSNEDIVLENAIEPEIAELLKIKGNNFTPIDINIQKGVTLLTGANMGGKSVSLRTIALNIELARFGFLCFAKKIVFKIPDYVIVISGDYQDVNSGLSSFGAEIIELSSLLNKLDNNCLLAICDEFGRSTNPYEGSRFVQALSEKLQSSFSYGIIATHYDGIKTKGAVYYQVAGLKDLLNKELDSKSISNYDLNKYMDYHLIRLSEATKVPREALKIGTLLGLPESFIESLKKYYYTD